MKNSMNHILMNICNCSEVKHINRKPAKKLKKCDANTECKTQYTIKFEI